MIYTGLQVASLSGGQTIRQTTFQQSGVEHAFASINSVKVAYGVHVPSQNFTHKLQFTTFIFTDRVNREAKVIARCARPFLLYLLN